MEAFSLHGRALPPAFERREIVVERGCVLLYDKVEWRDALIVVESGEVEVESLSGACLRLERGAVLWLADLPVKALRNSGKGSAVLTSVRRR
jgi:hypothetical protein